MRLLLHRWTALACVVLASLLAAGCGGTSSSRPHASAIRVAERDFKISAPKVVSAGDHVFVVDNHGPDDHELIVVREGKRELPFRKDGLTVDEDGVEPAIAGALEPQEPGTHELRVHLKPGHYVLLCNMSGHYLGGMDRDIEVR